MQVVEHRPHRFTNCFGRLLTILPKRNSRARIAQSSTRREIHQWDDSLPVWKINSQVRLFYSRAIALLSIGVGNCLHFFMLNFSNRQTTLATLTYICCLCSPYGGAMAMNSDARPRFLDTNRCYTQLWRGQKWAPRMTKSANRRHMQQPMCPSRQCS